MISIITCSINKEYLNKFIISIQKTIDVNYELIVIDNHVDKLGIAKAYNKGAKKSKFNYYVFVHEDVEFINKNWASNVLRLLKNSKIGIVGVAGSNYLPTSPTSWYLPDEKFNNVFIHQGFKYSGKPKRFDCHGVDLSPVYLLDGVFLAMRKDVFDEFPFNESIGGFHAYDLDISHRVVSKYQNIFTNQIELLHHSEGKVDKEYFDTILDFKKQYLDFNYDKRNFIIEFTQLKQFYQQLRCYYEKVECIKKISPFIKVKFLGFKGYFLFHKFLHYER